MHDMVIQDIIGYIIDELKYEEHSFRMLIEWLNKDLKRSKLYRWSKESEISKECFIMDLQTYKKQIEKIKEIRSIFQKGRIFANNNTKGNPKKFTPVNMYLFEPKFYLNRGNMEKAKEQAVFSLNSCKKRYSERTYYRLKKKIKELGIKI